MAHNRKKWVLQKTVKNNNLIEFSTFYCPKKSNCVFTDHIIIIICCWYQSQHSASHLGRLNGDDNNNKDKILFFLMSNQNSSISRVRVRVCVHCTCRLAKNKSVHNFLGKCPFVLCAWKWVFESVCAHVYVFVVGENHRARILWRCHFFNVFQHYVFVV